MREISIVEISAEFGAGTRGSSLGVDALRFACLKKGYNFFLELPYVYIEGDPDRLADRINFPRAKRIDLILELYGRIVDRMHKVFAAGRFPFIVSGDHSNATGTIAALKSFYPNKRVGVVWIDAHGDLHTPYTSPSGNIHGMPVGAILNLDNKIPGRNDPSPDTVAHWEEMCRIGGIAPKITPDDLVFIGIRDLEQEEWDVIEQNNILYFTSTDVNASGAWEVVQSTFDHLSHCDLLYVSFDVDSMDEHMVPGTGTPVEDGLSYGQAKILLREFWKSPKLACMEITEINPLLDYNNQTAEMAADLIHAVINQPAP
jgi:arginase